MLCLCGLHGCRGGSDRQRGWINIINDNGECSYEKILCYSWAFLLLGLSGCGKDEQDNSSYNLSVRQSEETIGLEENSSIEQETTDNYVPIRPI